MKKEKDMGLINDIVNSKTQINMNKINCLKKRLAAVDFYLFYQRRNYTNLNFVKSEYKY